MSRYASLPTGSSSVFPSILNRYERTRLAKKVTNDASKLDFHVTLLKRVSGKYIITRYQLILSEFSDRKSTSLTNIN